MITTQLLSKNNKTDPEKSLVYSIGSLFSRVYLPKETVTAKLTKKSNKFIEEMMSSDPNKRPSLDSVNQFKWTTSKSVSFDAQAVSGGSVGDKRKWDEKKKFKKGPITPDELEILKHAICRYVQHHALGEGGLLKLVTESKDPEVRGAWTRIAEALPDRTVQSCHNAARTHFHPGNYKGKWSESEEHDLLRLVDEKGRKWEEIARELGRTAMNCRDKYKTMGEENWEERRKGILMFCGY
jgi:hypothetical protein